jgi:low affinity Fe/Cu permease
VSALFSRLARRVATAAGSPWASLGAVAVVLAWLVAGVILGFSDTMQLVINTGTTIVTFVMVFLIQASQNHDTAALHLKLDELLRAVAEARTDLARAEDLSQEELEAEIKGIKDPEAAP